LLLNSISSCFRDIAL